MQRPPAPVQASPQAPSKPLRQHVVLDYMIYEDSIIFEMISKDHYKMKFKYTAESDLMCSIFTFVEESFNIQSYTTENMEISKEHGFEKHISISMGKEKMLEVPDIKVATGQPYIFAEHLVNNYYPLIIRLVRGLNYYRRTN
jgi:hypothetical protein